MLGTQEITGKQVGSYVFIQENNKAYSLAFLHLVLTFNYHLLR